MCGRNFAKPISRPAWLHIISFSRALWNPRHNVAKTVVAALMGSLLSGAVIAENQTPTEESSLSARSRSQTQDLHTTEWASKPVSGTETSDVSTDSSVLRSLIDSPERRKLAKELESLLREGKIEEAESRLNKTINVSTFALLIINQLRMPSFLAELQALGLQDNDQPTALLAAGEKPLSLSTDSSGEAHVVLTSDELAELKAAKDREQQRADALARDLSMVTEEMKALQALRAREAFSAAADAEKWAELGASLEMERQRADAITRDLAVMAAERHAQQNLREEDSILVASTRRDLQELKEELRRERQEGQAASAMRHEREQSRDSWIGEPRRITSLAPDPRSNAPETISVQPKDTVPTSTNALRGVPNVLDTATLSLQGRTIRLFGVQADGGAGSAKELTQYLNGREVACEPVGATDIYRCQVDGRDLSIVVLFNGGGRAAPDATLGLTRAADRARSARVGVWSK
jgi:hypothetical protein